MKRLAAAILVAAMVAMTLPVTAEQQNGFADQGPYNSDGSCAYWEPPFDDEGEVNPQHDASEYTCVGDRIIDKELVILSNPVTMTLLQFGVRPGGTHLTGYHLTENATGAGANNLDGIYFELPPQIIEMDVFVDCLDELPPEANAYCATVTVPIWEYPDPDVVFFDAAGNLMVEDCADPGMQYDCIIPALAEAAYVFNFAGPPTLISAVVTEVPSVTVPTRGPCDLPHDFEKETGAFDPPGTSWETRNNGSMFQTTQWNDMLPMCNHQPQNSWCRENGWPSRVVPGKYGPPAESDGEVPSRCGGHLCSGAPATERRDPSHACYDQSYEDPDPQPPEDPLAPVQNLIDNIGDIDPVEVAEDEAHWALNGTAVRWVREFTPARCSETAETAPYGCDDYWQADE